MTLHELYSKLDSCEITEWIAYDKTNSEDWNQNYKKELELERTTALDVNEKVEAFKKLFGKIKQGK